MSFLDPALWTGKVYTDGWTDGAAGALEVREAATGDVLGDIGIASVAQARKPRARLQPPNTTGRDCGLPNAPQCCAAPALCSKQHGAEIEEWIVRESGGTRAKAGAEVQAAASECYEAAALPSHPHGEVLDKQQGPLVLRPPSASRRSHGDCTIQLPADAVHPLCRARTRALGNAVLLKPDPRTSVSGGVVLQRVFEEAGLPAGVLQTLPGGADVGEAVVAAPEVRIISFTGSTAAGRRVGEAAARHLKRAHLELGGNNAIVVLPGADVPRAASAGRIRFLPAPGPDLHGHRPPPGTRRPSTRTTCTRSVRRPTR